MPIDIQTIRNAFPAISQKVNGSPLVYLDNAAMTQVPQAVINTMRMFEEQGRANVHRSMHILAERASVAYEEARATIQKFLNAKHPHEIIFTKNCTESINLVAHSFGETLQDGDTVLLSYLDHHSNIVPWLQLKKRKNINIEWIEIDEEGHINLSYYEKLLEEKNVKLVAITGQSNVLGVRPPIKKMIEDAHAHGARVLVDAAQLVAHHSIDVQELDCDFLAFSGHKMYGPSGIGVLYGKRALLESIPPFLGGGMMIHEVKEDGFSSADIPAKFEAGTPPITQAIGLKSAVDWMQQFDWNEIEKYETSLIDNAYKQLSTIDGISLLGPKNPKEISGCISFVIDRIHPHDLTEILGNQGICLRAGHHCTQPLHRKLGLNSTARISVGIYNNIDDIQQMQEAMEGAQAKLLG